MRGKHHFLRVALPQGRLSSSPCGKNNYLPEISLAIVLGHAPRLRQGSTVILPESRDQMLVVTVLTCSECVSRPGAAMYDHRLCAKHALLVSSLGWFATLHLREERFCQVRWRAKTEQPKDFKALPEGQDHILVLTVSYVSYTLDSGLQGMGGRGRPCHVRL